MERGQGSADGGLIRISGSIESVIYSNEDNGYAICDMGTDDGDEMITIVGTLPMIAEGDCVAVWGRWIHSPKYGDQFRVEQYEREMPAGVSAIRRYLAAGAIRGIGAKTADRIVAEFGEDTFDVMENHPEWLATIKGITAKRAEEIGEEFRAKAGIRNAMLFFRDYFGAALTVRIYKQFGTHAVDIAKKNPYRLCEEVEGIGFEKADAMAQQLGLSRDGQDRIQSGLRYLLRYNAAQSGHVCLPYDKLAQGGAQMLSTEEDNVREAIRALVAAGKCKMTVWDGVG